MSWPASSIRAFCALNLARLPPVDTGHVDVTALLAEISALRREVRAITQLKVEVDQFKTLLQRVIRSAREQWCFAVHHRESGKQVICWSDNRVPHYQWTSAVRIDCWEQLVSMLTPMSTQLSLAFCWLISCTIICTKNGSRLLSGYFLCLFRAANNGS